MFSPEADVGITAFPACGELLNTLPPRIRLAQVVFPTPGKGIGIAEHTFMVGEQPVERGNQRRVLTTSPSLPAFVWWSYRPAFMFSPNSLAFRVPQYPTSV